jgi:hypothetical protein
LARSWKCSTAAAGAGVVRGQVRGWRDHAPRRSEVGKAPIPRKPLTVPVRRKTLRNRRIGLYR